jgi:Uma2 family endonuclease
MASSSSREVVMGGTTARRTIQRTRRKPWPARGPLPAAALTPGTRLTLGEYRRTPETNLHRELFFGVVRDGATTARHQGVVVQLVVAFELFNRAHLHGFVGVSASDVVLDRKRDLVLQPDVYLVGPDRLGMVGRDMDGPPNLVVEVLSPSGIRYDRVTKRELYRTYGIQEYWIVDPFGKTIEAVHWVGDDRVESSVVYRSGETVRSHLWPRLTVAVDSLWGPLAP